MGIVYPFPGAIARGNFGFCVVCFAFEISGGVEVTLNAAFIMFPDRDGPERARVPFRTPTVRRYPKRGRKEVKRNDTEIWVEVQILRNERRFYPVWHSKRRSTEN